MHAPIKVHRGSSLLVICNIIEKFLDIFLILNIGKIYNPTNGVV